MVCLEGIIVHELRSYDIRVEVCEDWEHRDSIVVENSPWLFRVLFGFFDKEYSGFANLVKLLLENDLKRYFLGTHNRMDRTLARLKKFMYIARQESAELPFTDLFRLVFRDLNNIIDILEYYKDDVHRVRDKVHELVYPVLRDTLRRFLFIDLYYMPYHRWSTRRYIHCRFEYDRLDNTVEKECELVVETSNPYIPSETIPLTLNDVRNILEKQIQRIERSREQRRLLREYWKYMDGEQFWDPLDDLLYSLNQFLEGVN